MVAASALPYLWSVIAYPVDKGTVYTGPITFWIGVSLAFWMLCSTVCLGHVLWVHFRRRAVRRQSWYALTAGECAFVMLVAAAGAIVNHGLDGGLFFTWGDLVFAAVAVVLVVSLRRQRRAPGSEL
jgi:hypothetical protein